MDNNDRDIVNTNIQEIKDILRKLKVHRGWSGPEEVEKEFDKIEAKVDNIKLFLVGEENERESSEKPFLLPPRAR